MSGEESDVALVQRVLGGDVEAFAGLVARHRDRGLRYAAAMLGESADAEEAVQDAFVRAYRCAGQVPRAGPLRRLVPADPGEPVPDPRGGAAARAGAVFVRDEAALERAAAPRGADPEWREEIARALAQLDPLQREAFLLKHVEELEYEEMARLTGAGTSALKMRVMRACERLRVLLSEVDDARRNSDPLLGRVAAELRKGAPARPGFDARVMAAVLAAPPSLPARAWTWLTEPRPVAFSPLGGLALAAGVAVLVILGLWGGSRAGRPGESARPFAVAPAAAVAPSVVTFVLVAPRATSVALAGDFDGWNAAEAPLQRSTSGLWSVQVVFQDSYQYLRWQCLIW